ncbi:MAG: phage adaptor protein [Geminicoccaceae bacterium]
MSITNFGELKTAVENWMTRPDAFITARIPEFIALGEAMLFTDLRVREMEASSTITTTAAQQTDSLPARFVQARSLYISGTGRLEYRSPAEFRAVYSNLATGTPAYFSIVGENFLWAPTPNAILSIVVDHYARPAAFSDDADTNAVISRWPNLYLYASLIHAAPYIANDPRLPTLAGLYDSQVEQAHAANARDRYSGDPAHPQRQAQMT